MDIRNFGTLRKRQSSLDVHNELLNEDSTVELNQILSTDASVQPKDSNLPQTSAAASVNLKPEFDLGTLEDGPARPVLNAYPVRNKRKFLKNWFDEYSWLEYSVNEDASYCFPCRVMQAKKRQHDLLVRGGFTNFKNATSAYNSH